MNALSPTRIVILGAAGRDFHDFNMVYRDDPRFAVIAFTAAQIPGIAGRRYPAGLAGPHYPDGIPIVPESELEALCLREKIDLVVFAYSDVRHADVMHLASRALACGADFALLGPLRTQLASRLPVIAVSAVRTGCGKSQTARHLSRRLREAGRKAAIIRHPMPYGDLDRERVQRFASRDDLAAAHCTVEEREEYEPHIAAGNIVYAGVDYAQILRAAESDADLILWDGGNNDFPFVRPDIHIVLVDPMRRGDESAYHPGEAVLRMGDIIVVAKTNAAPPYEVAALAASARALNGRATLVYAASPVRLEGEAAVAGRRVVVVEDGPTLLHGGMPHGAGYAAAVAAGATVVDPRNFAAAPITALYDHYPHLGPVVPALGYSDAQLSALAETLARVPAEVVVAGTPVDLAALLPLDKPVVRARYDYADAGTPTLWDTVSARLRALR